MALKNGILSNTLTLSMALELGKLDEKTGIGFAQLFDSLKLSLSKQREIFTMINEIAHRDDASMLAVLENPALQAILNNNQLDGNQKARKIRKHLKQVRFPNITKAELAFKASLEALNLHTNAKLIPPENFESTMYTLQLTFSSFKELQDHQLTFRALIENPSIQSLLS